MRNKIPSKYQKIFKKCSPLLKKGRPDDYGHAQEVVDFILDYRGKINLDKDILIPAAIMHDIGHSAILPKHFEYIAGPDKIVNGKLVHMLAGAKIANDILNSVKYDKNKIQEIVDIISIHDFDQLSSVDFKKFYDTENKKVFHDIDSLDRYTTKRIKAVLGRWKDRNKIMNILNECLKLFFFDEFRKIAQEKLKKLIV